jgi:hypothetical protein
MSTIFGLSAFAQDTKYYELRTYYTNEGKRPDLIKRFQDHTLKLFKKNGMENVAYFLPVDESNQTLIYFLAYPDKAARDKSWEKFMNDPDWKDAYQKSIVNGKLVSKVESVFLTKAPELNAKTLKSLSKGDKVFELRTYHCFPGKLGDLNARFRDHTQKLFEKHGMTNVAYWFTEEKDGEQSKLVYLLAHKNLDAAKSNFDAFRVDPDWIKARDASEANGKIVEKVESIYLKALPFSLIK